MSMKFVSKLKGFAESVKDDLARRMLENSVYSNRLLFLSTLAQSPLPAGDFRKPVSGADIEAKQGGYVKLYENDTGHPIAVTIHAQFTGASGKQLKLSLSSNKETNAVIGYLSTTTSAPSWGRKFISDTIILLPKQRVYGANAVYGTFALEAADTFTPRVFDLAAYLVDEGWVSKN